MDASAKDTTGRPLEGTAHRPANDDGEPQRARLILPTDSRERARIVIGRGK